MFKFSFQFPLEMARTLHPCKIDLRISRAKQVFYLTLTAFGLWFIYTLPFYVNTPMIGGFINEVPKELYPKGPVLSFEPAVSIQQVL